MRTMLPRSPWSSLEFPGKLIPQIFILYTVYCTVYSVSCEMYWINKKWKLACVLQLIVIGMYFSYLFVYIFVSIYVHLFLKITNPNKHSMTSRPSGSLIELLLECYELVHTCNVILKCESRYAELNNKK